MRILLFTGKGGVGKSTVAAATALRTAEAGLRTLVCSTDPAHSLADAFDDASLGDEPTPIATLGRGTLFGQQLDARARLEESWGEVREYLTALLDWAGEWLHKNCPAPPQITIVHGDYRIGNFLEDNGKITAILDWELTHLGDPHEDLGWALVPTFNGGSRKLYDIMERNEVIDRYQDKSGITLSERSLSYYEAAALYQMAAIQLCAVHAFEVSGFNDMRMAAMATQMASIVRALDKAIEAAA